METIQIKGNITQYRLADEAPEQESVEEVIIPTDIKLPDDSPARVKVLKAENKKWYVTLVSHEETNQPFALFCKTNHNEASAPTSDAVERLIKLAYSKGIDAKHIESTLVKCEAENNVGKLTRTISLLLRHGVLIKNIVKCLDEMEDVFVGSFLFQIKKFLSQYIRDGEVVDDTKCTECGGQIVFSEGCLVCSACGHSKCG